jgi:hypothetical protein
LLYHELWNCGLYVLLSTLLYCEVWYVYRLYFRFRPLPVYFPHQTFVSDVSEIPISFSFLELPFSILFPIKNMKTVMVLVFTDRFHPYVLLLRSRDWKFGKWSPSWEGPYRITQVIAGNAYMLQTLQGKDLPKALNGRFCSNIILVCGKMLRKTVVITSSYFQLALVLLVRSASTKGRVHVLSTICSTRHGRTVWPADSPAFGTNSPRLDQIGRLRSFLHVCLSL